MAASDDGVREIQLSGKQLVFLFMAVTVVSVVIFLCGVLVGRGVQARSSAGAAVVAAIDDEADPTAAASAPAVPTGPTKVTGLEYQDRLEGAGAAPEKLTTRPAPTPTPTTPAPSPTPAATTPAPNPTTATAVTAATPSPPAAPPAATPAAPAAKEAPVSATVAEPKGDGFAIQVAALRGRGEAESVVARLKGKGYSAFLMPPLAGQPSVYRVRVGKFKTRTEAETVATRLEREEQFQPWITR